MRCEINHLDNDTLLLDQIDEAILLSRTGRTVAFPFASKGHEDIGAGVSLLPY